MRTAFADHDHSLRALRDAADAAFVAELWRDAPFEMRGMHPSPSDKPVVHNRELLQRVYRGETLVRLQQVAG